MMTLFHEDRPCTVGELENILTAPSNGFMMAPGTAYDEVYNGIFIGEGDSAKSIGCMKRLGITHVLNAALGKTAYHVNTNHVMYKRANIQFLGIEATDYMNQDMSQYFYKAADFISAGLAVQGKVFVHCVQGVSRSATLVLAYLMIKCHMTIQDATRLVRSKREICPNPGFLQQLCDFNEKLKKQGHFQPEDTETATAKTVIKKTDMVSASAATNRGIANCESKTCSVEEMEVILAEPMPDDYIWDAPFHQIDDYIYLGDGVFAEKVKSLKTMGVSHILNAAHGKGCDTDAVLYTPEGIHYFGIPAEDICGFDISKFFSVAADYIEGVLKEKGKVYVHCVRGMSRSATLIIAYFMLKQGKPLSEAVRLVKDKRDIDPNSSFVQQLCDLDLQLRKA